MYNGVVCVLASFRCLCCPRALTDAVGESRRLAINAVSRLTEPIPGGRAGPLFPERRSRDNRVDQSLAAMKHHTLFAALLLLAVALGSTAGELDDSGAQRRLNSLRRVEPPFVQTALAL